MAPTTFLCREPHQLFFSLTQKIYLPLKRGFGTTTLFFAAMDVINGAKQEYVCFLKHVIRVVTRADEIRLHHCGSDHFESTK